MYNTHYSKAQNLPALSRIAKNKAESLIKLFSKKEYKGYTPILAYSGMSGVAFATMIAFHLSQANFKYAMAYVRKPRENSHGVSVEIMYNSPSPYQFVFVDDFISSGATFNRVIKGIKKYSDLYIRYSIPSKIKKQYAMVIIQKGREQKYSIPSTFS